MMTLAIVLLGSSLNALAGSEKFVVESDFGEESAWVASYLDAVHGDLVRLMDARDVKPPEGIRVILERDPSLRGVGGWASPTAIGFSSDAWPKDKDRLWILAHELVNLFAVHYGGAGGYPSDWWSNGRSPFPEYLSCLVMKRLGYKEAADARRVGQMSKPDHALFWELDERYGFKLFARFLALVRQDAIDLGEITPPWPHPNEARSAYTMAYLSIAAKTNLADVCSAHGIGDEPDDWMQRHPEIPFVPYRVSAGEVDRIIAVREALFSRATKGEGFEILRDLFRRGGTYVSDESDAAEEGPVETPLPAGDKAIAFQIDSQFGAESAWTESFLDRTAAALLKLMGSDGGALPKSVPVVLVRDPKAGGIGGGAEKDRIVLVSDSWPDEPFRRWILAQELAEWMSYHLGGKSPAD